MTKTPSWGRSKKHVSPASRGSRSRALPPPPGAPLGWIIPMERQEYLSTRRHRRPTDHTDPRAGTPRHRRHCQDGYSEIPLFHCMGNNKTGVSVLCHLPGRTTPQHSLNRRTQTRTNPRHSLSECSNGLCRSPKDNLPEQDI